MIQYSYFLLILRNDIKWNIFWRIMLSRKPKIWIKTRQNFVETVIFWLYFKVIISISQNILKYYSFIIVSSYFDSYLGFSGWHSLDMCIFYNTIVKSLSGYNTEYDFLHGIKTSICSIPYKFLKADRSSRVLYVIERKARIDVVCCVRSFQIEIKYESSYTGSTCNEAPGEKYLNTGVPTWVLIMMGSIDTVFQRIWESN